MTKSEGLPDAMFLIAVEDSSDGCVLDTLAISRTPTVLLPFAAQRFLDAASAFFRKDLDLGPVEWRMVFQLANEPGATAARCARLLGVDKGTMSRCLHRLAGEGYVQAGELHANGRSRGWHLTVRGRTLHNRLMTIALETQTRLLKGFDATEVVTLCNLLNRFLGNLDADSEQLGLG